MKNFLLTLTFIAFFSQSLFTQEDTVDLDDDMIEFDPGIFESNPFMKFSLGVAQPLYRGFQGDNLDQISVVVGFERYKSEGENIIKHTNYGIYGVGLLDNAEILATQAEEPQQFNLGAIGLMSSKGYGWKLGESSRLILGIEDGTGFAQLGYNFNVPDDPDPENGVYSDKTAYERLQNTYVGETRWTEYFKGYIKYQPTDLLSLDVSYGRQIIYPRLQFWYWTVSGMAAGAADGLANLFVKRVMKSFEDAAPIVYYVLKTGLAFAFYQVRKDNMHWPMDTAPALITDNFNFGLNFHF